MTARYRTALPLALLIALVLSGCASLPGVAGSCPPAAMPPGVPVAGPDAPAATARCEPATAVATLAAIGGVQQTATQTRTLGVPRGFLIAMIVLIVLVSLA